MCFKNAARLLIFFIIKRDFSRITKQHKATVMCTGECWILRQKTEFKNDVPHKCYHSCCAFNRYLLQPVFTARQKNTITIVYILC